VADARHGFQDCQSGQKWLEVTAAVIFLATALHGPCQAA
jgi:hypothetical protein